MSKKLIETHFDPERDGTVVEYSVGLMRAVIAGVVTVVVFVVLRSCGY